MNIVIIGHVCIDKNTSEHGSFIGAGSPAMFMHRIFSQFPDCAVTIVAPYGSDFVPYQGSAVLYPADPFSIATLVYENVIMGAVRTQKCFNHETALAPVLTPSLIGMISRADCLCVAPLTPGFSPEYLASLLSHKKQSSFVCLLPQGFFRQFDDQGVVHVREFTEASGVLPLVDAVIVSDQDHGNMLELARLWAQKYDTSVIVTQAERGARLYRRDSSDLVQTIPVSQDEIVSSIGAGDIFSAGLMYRFVQTHIMKDAISFGHLVAGQCLRMLPDDIHITVR